MPVFGIILIVSAFAPFLRADIVEGFDPGGELWIDISLAPRISADTGYAWSGYYGGALWDMCMWDAKHLSINDGVLDMSGNNAPNGFDNINVWTIFNGDYISFLDTVKFEWLSGPTSARLSHLFLN